MPSGTNQKKTSGRSGSSSRGGTTARGSNSSRTNASKSNSTKRGTSTTRGNHAKTSTSKTSRNAKATRSSGRKKQDSLRSKKPVRYAIIALITVLIAIAALTAFDIILNFGRIHHGVSVAGVDVGGMTQEEAAIVLSRELTSRIEASPVELHCDELTLTKLINFVRWGPTVELDANLQDATGRGIDPLTAESWQIRALTVTASIDGEALAAEAFSVGRNRDFIFGRLKAWIGGVNLSGYLNYDEQQLSGLVHLLETALGSPIINADIVFREGNFVIIHSSSGIGVDQDELVQQMNAAFLSNERSAGIVLIEQKPLITDDAASELADRCNAAIAEPVILIAYDDRSWEINRNYIGSWLSTSIANEGRDVQLVVSVSSELMKKGLSDVLAGYDPGVTPSSARFALVDGGIVIIPSEQGRGIDYAKLAIDLERILFESVGSSRQLQLSVTVLNPEFSTADAQAMHITDKISAYTTSYGWSTPARANNIEVASGYVTNSLIAPGAIWSFNNTSGDATIERGYQVSKVISGSDYEDAVGGGVCQVATTVFNAVWEAGYPIVARANHGLYQWQYAPGRDAAVYYPWLDMKWENDTENWILLTVTCKDGYVTATLWGTNPGYSVVTDVGAWLPGEEFRTERKPNDEMFVGEEKATTEGVDGKIIYVTRRVYDTNGTLLRESTFKSVYGSVTEIVDFGTKPLPPPPPDPDPPPSTPSDGADEGGTVP